MRFFTIAITTAAVAVAAVGAAADQQAAAQLVNAPRAGSGVTRGPAGLSPIGRGQQMRMHRQVIRRSSVAAQQPRATQEQLDIVAKMKANDDEFHRKNSVWQSAVMKDLKAGKTPQDFATYWQQNSGDDSAAAPASDPAADKSVDDEEDDDEDDDDEDVTDADDDDEDDEDDDDLDNDVDVTNVDLPADTTVATVSCPDTPAKAPAKAVPHGKGKHTGSTEPKKPKKPTAATPSGSSSGNSGSSSGGPTNNGEGTYYNMAGGITACGGSYTDSDMVVALSHSLYDTKTVGGNPNNNGFCGKKLRASYQGKSVVVTAVDRCEGCAPEDLDFTPAAFTKLADMSLGRIQGVKWEWL
ncbi:unnamed protein product [Tilletia controversa]|uniref:RlpA-like protein double-psi beta-barrel domain-containing protein n=3 Tax=Tilletia TaxID=13289 RepID=A0A8X7MS23_9BASI|nr:hypothetical protein CF336_g4243 [Tilletia laevis]KAE8196650.1 hypothetical protein CF328_g4074 [Tilletia controversa]KAE8260690.1 hypothetical protein A4X03_0g3731 [Tilletia caries]KAE8202038.1 hypothetical protein CF335_g3564 [Tilletia laevis]KAE8247299.1 hypothetical protein A4X06_0g4557 [Tilletia controversa]